MAVVKAIIIIEKLTVYTNTHLKKYCIEQSDARHSVRITIFNEK